MTAQEIMDIIVAGEYEFYGIRRDRDGIEIGQVFPNSHEWYQDDPHDWDESGDYPYNEDLGLWDGGELDGVSTLRLSDCETAEDVEKIIKASAAYASNGPAYLVAGDSAEGGNDINELIICNGVCIAKI